MELMYKKSRLTRRRSREGAWIEIRNTPKVYKTCSVAPVRERGLKLKPKVRKKVKPCRSREGAWIEM